MVVFLDVAVNLARYFAIYRRPVNKLESSAMSIGDIAITAINIDIDLVSN